MNHINIHPPLIQVPGIISGEQRLTALHYSHHCSAVQEEKFVWDNLAHQINCGHIFFLPYNTVIQLPRIWISPVATISQKNIKNRIIYDFT